MDVHMVNLLEVKLLANVVTQMSSSCLFWDKEGYHLDRLEGYWGQAMT